MWKCKKCEKPVYFAERIQSLGFDWHAPCLVCKECGKKLHPGQHAEHAAEPYCHHPCYGALFGPRLFGHGTRNECHGAFGKVNKVVDAERALLENKVKEFNQVYDGKPGEITCREVNGRVVLEGIMRVHWAVDGLIHLKQEDETADTSSGPLAGAGSRVVGRTSVLLGTPGVSRSRSNSSVNNSGPASDDSDDDEPLWRDDSPPATPRGDTPSSSSIPSTPTTPNPNWPPTPYPTLKPSSSSKLASSSPSRKVIASGIRPSGSSSDIASGPQCSPVMSYTHNAPPNALISHPLSSFNATEDYEDDSLSMFINENVVGDHHSGSCENGGDNVRTLCKKSPEEIYEDEKWNAQSSVLADDFEYGGSLDSRYATLKTRTVRRRKDIDKAMTHSMVDSLLFHDKDGSVIPCERHTEPHSIGNESGNDANCSSCTETNASDNSVNSSLVRSDSIKETSNSENSNNNNTINNNNDFVTNGLTNTIKRANSIQKHNNSNKTSTGIVKRVSFSQVDWNEKLGSGSPELRSNNTNTHASINSLGSGSLSPGSGCGEQTGSGDPGTPALGDGANENGDDGKSSASEGRRTPTSRGKAVLRRRPGRKMDKTKVKRRCSINGHLYLRETSSFHLDPDCPPAVVRVTSLTTTAQLITTILEKYKIEMSSSNFALYVLKDNGEQRRLTQDEAPLTTRVMLGPHDSIAKIVLCDAKTTANITPEMAEFLHLSLAECRAILRQYENEEQRQIRAVRARYDEMKFYIQYWLEQMDDKEKKNGNAALAI